VLPFIDLTDEIVRLFREELTRQAASIDSSLGQQIALRETADSIWNTAAKPIPVGESAWLLIKPNRVSASPVTFDSAGLHWSMKLEAYPQVVLGTPPNDPPAALPLLTPTIPGNMFYVAMPVSAQYEFIETQLDHTLGIKQGNLRYPSGQDRQVSVKDLRLYAYGDKAVVRAVIVGSYGILRNFELVGYLIGTPHFDSERNVLSFPDLDFTIDTGNLLLKAADWLKHDEIRDDLRRRLTVDITEPAKNARTTLERTLNQRIGAVALTGKINDLRLTSVKTDPGANSFRADTILQGTLSATIP
jgi:hypothetical protein